MGDATGGARAHTRWELGYQLWYTVNRHRVFDALGPSVNRFEVTRAGPMVGPTATIDPYWATTTVVETSAQATNIVATNTAGVAARITTDNQEYDGMNIQASGAAYTLTANMPLWFGAKIAINQATSTDLFIGLCATRTEILKASSTHILHASTKSHVGFYKVDAGTATKYIAEKGGVPSSSSADTMTTSAITYELYWNGSNMTYYIDGSVVGTVTSTAYLPATGTALRPSLCFRTGNAAARQCDIYWWRCIQVGQ